MAGEKLEFVNVSITRVKAVTDKAVLVILEADDSEHWIPRSNLSTPDDNRIYAEMANEVIRVVDWFARKEGLI